MGLRLKKSIYLFRHGETSWNAEGRIQGHHDIPLNDCERVQARRIVTPIRSLKVEAILSSDLSRPLSRFFRINDFGKSISESWRA